MIKFPRCSPCLPPAHSPNQHDSSFYSCLQLLVSCPFLRQTSVLEQQIASRLGEVRQVYSHLLETALDAERARLLEEQFHKCDVHGRGALDEHEWRCFWRGLQPVVSEDVMETIFLRYARGRKWHLAPRSAPTCKS